MRASPEKYADVLRVLNAQAEYVAESVPAEKESLTGEPYVRVVLE